MTEEDLHDEIDALGIKIEQQIQKTKKQLEETPDFDSKYRRMQEAQQDVNAMELFS